MVTYGRVRCHLGAQKRIHEGFYRVSDDVRAPVYTLRCNYHALFSLVLPYHLLSFAEFIRLHVVVKVCWRRCG